MKWYSIHLVFSLLSNHKLILIVIISFTHRIASHQDFYFIPSFCSWTLLGSSILVAYYTTRIVPLHQNGKDRISRTRDTQIRSTLHACARLGRKQGGIHSGHNTSNSRRCRPCLSGINMVWTVITKNIGIFPITHVDDKGRVRCFVCNSEVRITL